jgi:hypothetical protein
MPLPHPSFRLSSLLWLTLAVACWFGKVGVFLMGAFFALIGALHAIVCVRSLAVAIFLEQASWGEAISHLIVAMLQIAVGAVMLWAATLAAHQDRPQGKHEVDRGMMFDSLPPQ